jgi:hypothetical protein
MIFWLVDNASLLYAVLGCAFLVLLAVWWQTRKRPYLICLGIVAALAGLVFVLALFVDTDRKQIVRNLRAIAAGMQERPPHKTFAFFSKKFSSTFLRRGSEETWDFNKLCANAIRGQEAFQITGLIIRDIQIKEISDTEATVAFEAMPEPVSSVKFYPCEARFVREDGGVWRVRALKLFDPENPDRMFNIPL